MTQSPEFNAGFWDGVWCCLLIVAVFAAGWCCGRYGVPKPFGDDTNA